MAMGPCTREASSTEEHKRVMGQLFWKIPITVPEVEGGGIGGHGVDVIMILGLLYWDYYTGIMILGL